MDKIEFGLLKAVELAKNHEYEKALQLCKRLKQKSPNNEIIVNTLGVIYRRLGRYKEAFYWTERAIALKPSFWAAHNNLARVFHDVGMIQKCLSIYKKIIASEPNYIEARVNLAITFKSLGDYKSSLEEYRKILEIKETNLTLFHIALTRLCLGMYREGFDAYEVRWKVSPLNKAVWPIKGKDLWKGQKGKKLLLWKEQGIGDDILFMGLVSEASKVAGSTIVYTDPRLVPLCKRGMPGITFKPYKGKVENEDFDYHLPMGSLPKLFRSSEKDFENTVYGYLKADKRRVEALREELGIGNKKVIGISWKSIKSLHTLKKSLNLMKFGRIFEGLDVTLLNLQYGDVDKEIKEFTKATGIEILQCKSVDNREDLDGLAALIETCDLVVSTSNVTIHLSGALGKKTWVLLPYVANFWWLLNRTDSIWYPSLTLYRQEKYNEWNGAFIKLSQDLCNFCQ